MRFTVRASAPTNRIAGTKTKATIPIPASNTYPIPLGTMRDR
jgi:hypothetical protein